VSQRQAALTSLARLRQLVQQDPMISVGAECLELIARLLVIVGSANENQEQPAASQLDPVLELQQLRVEDERVIVELARRVAVIEGRLADPAFVPGSGA